MTPAAKTYNELVDELRELRRTEEHDTSHSDLRLRARSRNQESALTERMVRVWGSMTDEEKELAWDEGWRGSPELYDAKQKESD